MIDALPRRVPIGILLEYNAYSEFLTLEPLDNLPYWRVVMSFHTCCSTLRRCLYGGSLLNWCHVHSIHKVDTVPKSEIGVPIILGANHMEVATDVFVWSCRRPDPWLLVVRCPWGASDSTELRQLVGMPNDPAYRRTINSFHSRCMHWPVQASGFYTRCSESGGGGGGEPSFLTLHIHTKIIDPTHVYTLTHFIAWVAVRYDNMCKMGLQGPTLRSLTWFCKQRFDWWTWFSTRCSQCLTICKIMGLTPVVRGTTGQIQLCRSK